MFTKEKWGKLNEQERSWLSYYHKHCNQYGGSVYNAPEDCGYCPVCDQIQRGRMVCSKCVEVAEKLYKKMEGTK